MYDTDHHAGHRTGHWQTGTETGPYSKALAEQEQRERELCAIRGDLACVPGAWTEIDPDAPVEPVRKKVTVRIDADMLAWFRSLGHGHQRRMNVALRAYMNMVLARGLKHTVDCDPEGEPI